MGMALAPCCYLQADEAMEVKPRRGGGSRGAATGFGSSQMPRQSSRRAAAAGVSRAVAADQAAGQAHSPSPSYQQGWEAAPSAGVGGGKSGGRGRGGRSGRNSRAAESEDDDFWEDEDESDEGLTAWGDGDDGDDDGACFGGTVLGGGYAQNDYSSLSLKPDHYNRPLWVCSDGRIFLETYSPIYKQVSVMLRTRSCLVGPAI